MGEDDSIQPGDEVWLDSSDDRPEPAQPQAAPTRAQPRRRAGMKIVTEVGVFGVGLGLLLTLAGGALLAAGGGDATVGGIPRRLILAVPMIALGLVHLGSGTLVLIAVPAALYLRGREALAELSGHRATRPRTEQQVSTGWRPRPGG